MEGNEERERQYFDNQTLGHGSYAGGVLELHHMHSWPHRASLCPRNAGGVGEVDLA